MFDFNSFPSEIKKRISGLDYRIDNIGESGSVVIMFDDMVLKIERTGTQSNREYEVMNWLQGKLAVPVIIAFEKANGYNYLLMSRLNSMMACDEAEMHNPYELVEALADG